MSAGLRRRVRFRCSGYAWSYGLDEDTTHLSLRNGEIAGLILYPESSVPPCPSCVDKFCGVTCRRRLPADENRKPVGIDRRAFADLAGIPEQPQNGHRYRPSQTLVLQGPQADPAPAFIPSRRKRPDSQLSVHFVAHNDRPPADGRTPREHDSINPYRTFRSAR